jgi:hypothetical protein
MIDEAQVDGNCMPVRWNIVAHLMVGYDIFNSESLEMLFNGGVGTPSSAASHSLEGAIL